MSAQETPKLDVALRSIEKHYNKAQSLTLSFTETYKSLQRAPQVETGTLFLRKPGKMRWEYASPAGKLFVSDGKNVFLYTPESHRAEHSKLKETEDLRAPLAFLLGKLDFYKEFRGFSLLSEGTNVWVVAQPNSPNLPYSRVEFLAHPADGRIERLRVIGQDQSIMEFQFSGEKTNVALSPKLFAFSLPPGVELVESEQ